jgi:hypothetical protein
MTGLECECIVAGDGTTLGSGLGVGRVVLLDSGFPTGLTERGVGGFLAREPIFSAVVRGDEGDCSRYDRGVYIIFQA